MQPNLHWIPRTSSYPGSYHVWTWEEDDDDDDAGELLVQQATTYATKLCDFVGGREMSGGLLLCSTGFQQQTKEVGFFSTKQKRRGLKRRTKEQLATKLPFEE